MKDRPIQNPGQELLPGIANPAGKTYTGAAHPDTSREAAKRMAKAARPQAVRVFRFIETRGAEGATDQEACKSLGLTNCSVNPRRLELVEAGLVKDSGRRRKTASGRNATVWVATGKPLTEGV